MISAECKVHVIHHGGGHGRGMRVKRKFKYNLLEGRKEVSLGDYHTHVVSVCVKNVIENATSEGCGEFLIEQVGIIYLCY